MRPHSINYFFGLFLTLRSSFDLFRSGPKIAHLFPLPPLIFFWRSNTLLSGSTCLLLDCPCWGFWIYAKPSQDDARGKVAAWFDICITVGLPSPLASILIVTFPLSQGRHTSRGISGRK